MQTIEYNGLIIETNNCARAITTMRDIIVHYAELLDYSGTLKIMFTPTHVEITIYPLDN